MAGQATEVEAQLLRVTSELAEYKAESASLQNQTHTIRALQDKVKTLENSLQEQVGCAHTRNASTCCRMINTSRVERCSTRQRAQLLQKLPVTSKPRQSGRRG